MADSLHPQLIEPQVIELTTDDGVPIAAARPPRRRRPLLLGLVGGALALLLAAGLTGYLLLREGVTNFATGTWDCAAGDPGTDQVTFVAVFTDTTFTVTTDDDSDDPLTGTWQLSGARVVLQVDATPAQGPLELTGVPRRFGDHSYELTATNDSGHHPLHMAVSGHGRRVRLGLPDGGTITCGKR